MKTGLYFITRSSQKKKKRLDRVTSSFNFYFIYMEDGELMSSNILLSDISFA